MVKECYYSVLANRICSDLHKIKYIRADLIATQWLTREKNDLVIDILTKPENTELHLHIHPALALFHDTNDVVHSYYLLYRDNRPWSATVDQSELSMQMRKHNLGPGHPPCLSHLEQNSPLLQHHHFSKHSCSSATAGEVVINRGKKAVSHNRAVIRRME